MENNSILDGNGIIILILFFLMMGGGFGGWGGNNAAVQGALTRADVTDAITLQNLENGIGNVNNGMNIGFAAVQNTSAATLKLQSLVTDSLLVR